MINNNIEVVQYVMHVYVCKGYRLSPSMIFLLDFGTVPTVLYLFVFLVFGTVPTVWYFLVFLDFGTVPTVWYFLFF